MPERLIGSNLGKYKVHSLLGTGGFAWVYAASDPELEVDVALKVLKPQYAGNVEFEERFRREASTAAKLRHPNIIKIYAVGRDGPAVYFAMDLYPQRLSQRLEVMGTLPEPALLKLGLDVSSALGFAHRQGVIHRDIKADNILFDDHGNAIVADFGIARAAARYADQTGTNVILGTPQFFAPEQARGQPTDARADIYSLGVTLYLAGTGCLPFSGEDWYEIATKHVQEPVPPPRSINPQMSPEMERIIMRCMEKQRDDRYPSADLLYAELETMARQRAGDANAATIRIATPVTGRHLAISPQSPAKRPNPLLGALVYLGAFVASAAIFVAVDQGRGTTSSLLRMPVLTVEAVRGDGPDVNTDVPGVPIARGRSNGGGASPAGTTLNSLEVSAPSEAVILLNGVQVSRGTFFADTLSRSYYRVTAQLDPDRSCPWGRDSTTADFTTGRFIAVTLRPRACGSARFIVTNDAGAPIDFNYEVRSDSSALLREGRSPLGAPVVLPEGTHRFTVSSPSCAPYIAPHHITADSVLTVRAPLICRRPQPPEQLSLRQSSPASTPFPPRGT